MKTDDHPVPGPVSLARARCWARASGLVVAVAGAVGLLGVTAPAGCHRQGGHPGHDQPSGTGSTALARVAAIHGGAGPFAVAGYRIGARALRELGLAEGSFDIDVQHESPAEVQWSCIADGVQASTGASPGKLNLRLTEVPVDALRTVVRRKSNGQSLAFRLTPAFRQRFVNLPRERLSAAGQEVLALRDEDIFTVEKLPASDP